MFARNRTDTRHFFRTAWRKRCQGLVLEPLEALVATVVAAHPEYHHSILVEALPDATVDPDPVDNPFLHLGLHVALLEQLQADRPPGIRAEFQRLLVIHEGVHLTEHRMLQVLAEVLWAAQAQGVMPDEDDYLASIRQLR